MSEKKAAVVEKHYERRWLEAKGEIIKDAGPVVDLFVAMHEQCKVVADKHKVDAKRLVQWLLEQLPISAICDGDDEEDEEYEEDEEEYEEEGE